MYTEYINAESLNHLLLDTKWVHNKEDLLIYQYTVVRDVTKLPTSILRDFHLHLFLVITVLLWRCNPTRAYVTSLLAFLDYSDTQSRLDSFVKSDQKVSEAVTYTTNTREEHLCPQLDSKSRSQQSSRRRPKS